MNASQLLSQLSTRIEVILSKEEDPQPLMSQIEEAAEAAGIIDAAGSVRTSSPQTFSMDLLTENPQAFEWAQMMRDRLHPLQIKTPADLLDAISAP